jgi:hypothetical protein
MKKSLKNMENKFKFLKQGKYLDDINWTTEIINLVNLIKSSKIGDINCEQLGNKHYSHIIKSKKQYILEEATPLEMIEIVKNYFQWVVMDKLTRSSPHIKKLFDLIFYIKGYHPYTFYYDDDMFYDYDYINSICEDIDDHYKKLKKVILEK